MTSQFENHMRAVAGLPLGRTDAVKPVVMHNCLGGVPALKTVCAVPGARLHDYGKKARPGRKCGHITVLASDEAALKARSRAVVGLLRQGGYDA